MDKTQAYYSLWSRFGIPAYDENSVPDDAQYPYITYQVITDELDYPVNPTASVWYRDTSWEAIDLKIIEIAGVLGQIRPLELDDHGYMYVTKGSPFAQRMAEEDRTVKRYVLNIGVEFLTSK